MVYKVMTRTKADTKAPTAFKPLPSLRAPLTAPRKKNPPKPFPQMFHLGRPELLEFGILAERINHLRQVCLIGNKVSRERDVDKRQEEARGKVDPSNEGKPKSIVTTPEQAAVMLEENMRVYRIIFSNLTPKACCLMSTKSTKGNSILLLLPLMTFEMDGCCNVVALFIFVGQNARACEGKDFGQEENQDKEQLDGA